MPTVTTHLIVTMPFHFEGKERTKKAEETLAQCRERFGEIVVLNNQSLFSQADEKTTFQDAFKITAMKIEDYVLKLVLD